MAKVTLKQISKRSGFSVTTVSRALGGFSDVNEETRQHIQGVADALGYHPNMIARQLQKQRTDTIGVVNPSQFNHDEDDFFSVLVKGVNYGAALHQFDVLLCSQFPNTTEVDSYRRIVGGNRVDGVVIARTYLEDERIKYLQSVNSPFVVNGRLSPNHPTDFPYIDVDSQAGIRLMIAHLTELGHQHIGFITPPADLAFTPYRLAGYRKGLEAAGIRYRADYVATGDLTRQSGYQAAQLLLESQPQLTAIVACNDLMALGAMDVVKTTDFTIGEDFAIGGFDDIPMSQHSSPSLTTIQQPIYDIGQQLAEMLIQFINNTPPQHTSVLIEPTLVIRDSTKHTHRERSAY